MLKKFDKSPFGHDLQNKNKIISKLDRIVNSNELDNKQKYIDLKNWYGKPKNITNLDNLQTRRGESKFWDIMDAIKDIFRKAILKKEDYKYKPTTMGVTGVKVTKSMHSYFKEKPEKKVDISDKIPSKSRRSTSS